MTEASSRSSSFGRQSGRGGRGGRGGWGRGGRGRGGKKKENFPTKQDTVKGGVSVGDTANFDLSASAAVFQPVGTQSMVTEPSKQDSSNAKTSGKTGANKSVKKGDEKSNKPHGKHTEGGKQGGKKQKGMDSNRKQKNNDRNDKPDGKPDDGGNKQGGKKQKGKSSNKKQKNDDRNEDKQSTLSNKPKQNIKQPANKSKSVDATPLAPSIPPNVPQQTSDINYGKGERIKVLHIAEKPSIGLAIAKGLAKGSFDSGGKGLPVHTFTDPSFPKAPNASKCTHKVTSVAGHVFNVDFPSQYQSWDSVDPAELFDAPIKKTPCKGSVVKHLQDEARGVDFIVLWNDCDREGENINFEVLDCCMHLMKSGGGSSNYDRVYRAHFSAINPSDIIKAYNSLGKPDKNQSLSVDARQELDLKVGVAFSRFQTRYFQGRYGDLDSAVLSYGPCQTPTLGFCVQRHIDIETFTPEPYWTLELGVLKRGRMLRATWGSGRSFNKNKVEGLVTKCVEDNATVRVTSRIIKEKKQGRPVPLNTVGMLKACSKALGIGPHAALKTAESLYLSGYLSYPRTESTAYPKSFDIAGTLQQQTNDNRWGNYCSELLRQGHTKSRGGVDAGDHPPITPCRSARAGELSGDMARVYDLVVRHFIASVSHDAVWRSTRVDFEIEALGDQGKFSVGGKEIITPGFLAVLMHKEYGEDADDGDEDEEERAIPEFEECEIIPLMNQSSNSSSKVGVAPSVPCWGTLIVKERMTTPPTYLTESELITKMEKHGIGTDASISTHIENVLKRNYCTLESGRRLVPSKLGLVLAQGYHMIDSSLVLPQVRSDIEDQCNKIAKGLANREDVVKRAIDIFRGKFDFFVKHIDRMDVLFSSSFAKLEDVGKPFTRCGITRRYLQFIPGPPARLYNKFTETVYPLPAGGTIKQWTGRKCTAPHCDFELCLYTVGQPPRTFPLCPNCFNSVDWSLSTEVQNAANPVDRDDANKEKQIRTVAGKALTLECPLPDNHPLIEELTVSPDPDSDGVFIVDPHFGPKWRMVSTRAPTIVYLPKSIEKLTVLDKTDEVLGCHLIKVEFKPNESPLSGGETNYVCSFPTDDVLQGMVRLYHGSERLKAPQRRGGRGRGGTGRGRSGRGRR